MKWYDWDIAPNPRRVRIYLIEKGLDIPSQDVGDGFVLKEEYRTKYPGLMVPMVELDDGTQIGEAFAVCRYFEELHPTPPMMGEDAKEKAQVEMWDRRAYDECMIATAEVFRNTHPSFADRGVPGSPDPVPQIPALVERGKARLSRFYTNLDLHLNGREFIVGRHFTVADITALCSIDFGKFCELSVPTECPNVRRWYEQISARDSAAA